MAGRWRQVLEGVFYNLDLQDTAASEYRKARALQKDLAAARVHLSEQEQLSAREVQLMNKLIDDKTRAIYIETCGNPQYNVPDLEAICKVAHEKGVAVICDNTFGAGGFLCQPLKHGVDILVESCTKW